MKFLELLNKELKVAPKTQIAEFIAALNERSSWKYVAVNKIPLKDQQMLVHQLNSERILRGESPFWSISDLAGKDTSYILYDTFGVATGLDSSYIYSWQALLEIAIQEGWGLKWKNLIQ